MDTIILPFFLINRKNFAPFEDTRLEVDGFKDYYKLRGLSNFFKISKSNFARRAKSSEQKGFQEYGGA